MPGLEVKTNLPRDKIPDDFHLKAAEILAKTLECPVEAICVVVTPDALMSFGQSKDPCALIQLGSMESDFDEQKNIDISKAVFDFIESSLGIPDNRAYIRFDGTKGHEVGYKSTTLTEYYKAMKSN